jgi:hypothetical protein
VLVHTLAATASALPMGRTWPQRWDVRMGRKVSVPEIPPVPSRRSDRRATGSGQAAARPVPAKQTHEPELRDLLDAFWGDGADTGCGGPTASRRSPGFTARSSMMLAAMLNAPPPAQVGT